MKKKISRILLLIVCIAIFFTGCMPFLPGMNLGTNNEPEVGDWHSELKISDLEDEMTEDEKLLLSMLTGNLLMEFDVTFAADHTFRYTVNTDELQDALADTVGSLLNMFMDVDITLFTDRLMEMAFQDAMQTYKSDYIGTYTKNEDDIINAIDKDGEVLYFYVNGVQLEQLDEDGTPILEFEKE